MGKRVLLAAVLGAIAMFMWMSVAHTMLSLGETGIQEIPNEPQVLTTMNSQIGNRPGLYMFPGRGLGPNATHAEKSAAMKDYDKKLAGNPSGILLYHPPGAKMVTGTQLITEFLTELLEAFLLTLLLARARITTFGGCLRTSIMAGLLAVIATNVPYWNWYGFPGNYTFGYMLTQMIGFICIGVVAGLVMRGETVRSIAATA